MSSQFTPGPWHWKEGLGRTEMPVLFGADGLPVCDFGMSETYYPVEGTPPEEADASLIAAAPELYEALAAAVANSDANLAAGQPRLGDFKKLYDKAAAALAKARGEQP